MRALAIAVGYTFSKGLGVNNAQLTRVPPARDSGNSSPLPISLGTTPRMLHGLMTIRI